MFYDEASYVAAGKFTTKDSWIHPSRVQDTNELLYVIEGTVYICEGFREYTLKKGDVLILEKNQRHYGFQMSEEGVSFYWMNFRADLPTDSAIKTVTLGSDTQMNVFFKELIRFTNASEYPSIAADYLSRLILIELTVRSAEEVDKRPPLVKEICDWIRANRHKNIKVGDVASHFKYNEDYIARFFKQYHFKGLKNYIDSEKMRYIKELLMQTAYPLKEIALLCGFDDYKYFLKFFTYHEELTPSQFRELYYNSDGEAVEK